MPINRNRLLELRIKRKAQDLLVGSSNIKDLEKIIIEKRGDSQERKRSRNPSEEEDLILEELTKLLTELTNHQKSKIEIFSGEQQKELKTLELEGPRLADEKTGISFSEILGVRYDLQQDAAFVGSLDEKSEAVQNPELFFKSTIKDIADKHQDYQQGTTLCSAIVIPKNNSFHISTANLGDSRASVIVKYQEGSETKYQSVSLTHDHSLNREDVKHHIITEGGRIEGGRVNKDGINMGASIGDKSTWSIKERKKNCLITEPDILEYDLNKICLDLKIGAESVIDVDLVVACDGIFDKIVDDSHFDDVPLPTSINNILSSILGHTKLSGIKSGFDKLKKDQKKSYTSFSDYLVQTAYQIGSTDNISAIHIPIIQERKLKVTKPIIATVCDGHGASSLQDVNQFLKLDESKKRNADGSLVSASVAAQLYVGAQVKELDSLKIDKTHQKPLFDFVVASNQKKSQSSAIPKYLSNETSDHLPQHVEVKLKKAGSSASSLTKITSASEEYQVKVNITTWNILNQCHDAPKPGSYSNNPWNYKETKDEFDKRRNQQAEQLKKFSEKSDIICLQECTEEDAKKFIQKLNERRRDGKKFASVSFASGINKSNITIYNEKRFSLIESSASLPSQNHNGSGTVMNCGLATTFQDKASGEKFLVENVHAPFQNVDLVAKNIKSLVSKNSNIPVISVGDFNADSKSFKDKNIGTISSDKPTNFDAKASNDRGINAKMVIKDKSYDMAHILLPKGYEADVKLTAKSFEENLDVKEEVKNFTVQPEGKVEYLGSAYQAYQDAVYDVFRRKKDSSSKKRNPPNSEERIKLRDDLADAILPEWLANALHESNQQLDGAEFITYFLDNVLDDDHKINDTTEVSWTEKSEKKTSKRTEKQTKLELSFAAEKTGKQNLSDMMHLYCKEAKDFVGENQYKTSEGKKVDANTKHKITLASSDKDLVLSLKRQGHRLGFETYKIENDVVLDPISLDTKAAGGAGAEQKQEYEATAFIVHRGSIGSGHYVTYIKEKNDSNKIVWALYNDSERTEVADTDLNNERLPKESSKAYTIKYSPLADKTKQDSSRYKTGLPESQNNGTNNGGVRCWANAGFAFALSISSLHKNNHKISNDTPSSTTTPSLKPISAVERKARSLVDSDKENKNNLEEVLKFIQENTKETKEINEYLKKYKFPQIDTLLQNSVGRYLEGLTKDIDKKKIEELFDIQNFLSDKKNVKQSIAIVEGVTKNTEDFKKEPLGFCAKIIGNTNVNPTKEAIKKSKKSTFSSVDACFEAITNGNINLFKDSIADAIRQDKNFLTDALCCATFAKQGKIFETLINDHKANPTKKSLAYDRSAKEIAEDKSYDCQEIKQLISCKGLNPVSTPTSATSSPTSTTTTKPITSSATSTSSTPTKPITSSLTSTSTSSTPTKPITSSPTSTSPTPTKPQTATNFNAIATNPKNELEEAIKNIHNEPTSVSFGSLPEKPIGEKIGLTKHLFSKVFDEDGETDHEDDEEPTKPETKAISIDGKEIKIEIIERGLVRTPVITSDVFSLQYQEKTKSKYWYAEFGGMVFQEQSGSKIFNNADLLMASFRNCHFENVDFSKVDNFETIKFNSLCSFKGCVFPKGFEAPETPSESTKPIGWLNLAKIDKSNSK